MGKDPASILEALLQRGGGATSRQRGKHGREIAGGSELLAWAREHGHIFDPVVFESPSDSSGGGEHVVVYDEESGRLYKITKPAFYGANAEDAGSYLQRWALCNRVFGDDVQFEGFVTLPGEDDARAVISQPFVAGRDSTFSEIADYMTSKGFREHQRRWVHPILGVSVWDISTPGNAITDARGDVHPIDFIIGPSTPEELRDMRKEFGIGNESSF